MEKDCYIARCLLCYYAHITHNFQYPMFCNIINDTIAADEKTPFPCFMVGIHPPVLLNGRCTDGIEYEKGTAENYKKVAKEYDFEAMYQYHKGFLDAVSEYSRKKLNDIIK